MYKEKLKTGLVQSSEEKAHGPSYLTCLTTSAVKNRESTRPSSTVPATDERLTQTATRVISLDAREKKKKKSP